MIYLISHASILIILLAASAFFSGSEAAIFSLNQIERKRLSSSHPYIGKAIEKLLDRPRRTLITILIGNLLVNTMAIAIATRAAVSYFGASGVGVTIAVFTFILLMVGEVTPKVFAVRNNVFFASLTSIPLEYIAKIIFPIRYLFRRFSDWVLSFLVKDQKSDSNLLLSENELKALVKIGEEEGVFRKEEEKMIRRLIDFGKRPVKQIMVARPDLMAFDIQDGRDSLVALIKKSRKSYIPVCDGGRDNLLGVISAQEFMLDTQNRLRELIEAPTYVPETKPIDELFTDFQSTRKNFAICVDEYGGTAGLVTKEDVLEEIFGEFYDEFTKEEPLVKEVGPREYLVDAKISLHDLNDAVKVRFRSELSETLNGWILEKLGRIPKSHESFLFEGIELRVMEATKQRILKVSIRKK